MTWCMPCCVMSGSPGDGKFTRPHLALPVGWCSVLSGAGREIEVRDSGGVVTAGGDGIVMEMVDVPDMPARRPLPPPLDGGQAPHRALRRAVRRRGPSSQRASSLQDASRARVDLLQQNERRTELASSAPSRTACLAPGIDVPGNYPDPGIIACCQSRRHRPTPGRSMESAALPRRRPSLPPHRAMRCQSEPGNTARPASE